MVVVAQELAVWVERATAVAMRVGDTAVEAGSAARLQVALVRVGARLEPVAEVVLAAVEGLAQPAAVPKEVVVMVEAGTAAVGTVVAEMARAVVVRMAV